MPIYEYSCAKCGNAFEHLHRKLGESAPACPVCASQRVIKQFSTFSAAVAPERGSAAPCGAAAACSPGQCAAGECPLSG